MKIPKNDGSGEFWFSNLHPEEDQPKPKPKHEKVIKLRMLLDHQSQLWTADGPRRDLRAGDEIRMTEEQGLRLVGNGLATEDFKTDFADLPKRDLDKTPEAVAAQRHPVIVAANERIRPPKIEPTQEEIDYRKRYFDSLRQRAQRLTGWSA